MELEAGAPPQKTQVRVTVRPCLPSFDATVRCTPVDQPAVAARLREHRLAYYVVGAETIFTQSAGLEAALRGVVGGGADITRGPE